LSLQTRAALEAVRTVLESAGPPGVTAITVHAPHGVGLRTARLQLARAARLAGYLVIDSRFGPLEEALTPPRHLCVIDWLSREASLPPVLAFAAASDARRHAWIRFCRHPVAGAGSIGLEPLMTRDLTSAIYVDPETGPTAAEVRCAVAAAGGRPGVAIDTLSAVRRPRQGASWVHETAPEYVVPARVPAACGPAATAGVARLERAVEAARALSRRGRHARAARLLTRCGAALAARGAGQAAAAAACALGELHLDRGRPDAAFAAFQRAQAWSVDAGGGLRAMIGSGRALLEQGRLSDAESVFRTAGLAEVPPGSLARRWLAETLLLRGRVEAAEEALGDADAALLSTIARLQGDLSGAARAATRALAAASQDDVATCAAHLAMAHVQAAMGAIDPVRRHAAAAEDAARRVRVPSLRLRVAAETLACLEQCGVSRPAARERLVRAARRLSALSGARIRGALGVATSADAALIGLGAANRDLIQRFRSLLAAIHESPDESAALQAIAGDLRASLEACSVVVRSAVLARQVAGTGRPWSGEEGLTRPVLDGSGTLFRDGVTPEAAEPVVAGGSILGTIAVRWVAGARPPMSAVRDVLRTAAVAAAPMLRALHVPQRASPGPELAYPDDLLGPGPAAERVRDAIRRAALAPYPVLIEGESGSG
jgi:tetratricopeptide (TPR) repeat protein